MTEWLLLGLSVLLMLVCGVFVAGEFALLAADRPTIDAAAEAGDRRAAGVAAAFRTLSTQLSGVQLAITLTNLAIGFLAEPALAGLLHRPLRAVGVGSDAVEVVAVALALVLSTVATMLFGELVPKSLAIAAPIAVAKAVQAPIRAFTRVMGPPIRALNAGAEAVLRQFGLHSQEELASARTPEELLSLVRHSAAEGTLPRQTARLVIRSLVFGDTRAAEVMTPRTRMVTIAPDATVSDFLTRSAEAGRSRLPVVGAGGLDEIVGIVELDRAVTVPGPRRDTTLVSAVMVAPLVVPHSLPVDDVVRALQTARLPLAIVADEYGGTAGLLTGEDLIEELVGDILDEFDAAPTQVRRTEHGWELSGLLRPDEVAAATGICLPDHGPYETVGGLVMQRLGRLPLTGDRIEFHEAFVTVIAMDRRRVDRVLLQPRAADREAIDRPTESR